MLAVTGITGHTGRCFINELVKNRYAGQLRCLVHTASKAGCITESGLHAEIVEGTLDEEADIRTLLSGADTVLHCVVIIGGYLTTVVLYFIPFEFNHIIPALKDCSIYYPIVGMGYVVAKHDVFNVVSSRIKHKIPIALFLIIALMLIRINYSVIKGFSIDVLCAPCFILSIIWLKNALRGCMRIYMLEKPLTCLGRMSLHIWYFHSIFFSAYTRDVTQPLVTWCPFPILRFLLVTILSSIAAFAVMFIIRCISQLTKYSKEYICNHFSAPKQL